VRRNRDQVARLDSRTGAADCRGGAERSEGAMLAAAWLYKNHDKTIGQGRLG